MAIGKGIGTPYGLIHTAHPHTHITQAFVKYVYLREFTSARDILNYLRAYVYYDYTLSAVHGRNRVLEIISKFGYGSKEPCACLLSADSWIYYYILFT